MLLCDPYARLTDEGGLHLDFKPHLDVELRISPWSDGLKLDHRLAENPQWSALPHEDPDVLLVTPPPHTPVMAQFLDSIPQTVCERVMPFGYRQFPMLRWLALLEEARALLEHHPLLLWLTVDAAQEQEWDSETMRAWLRQPLPVLLQATVGLQTRAALRFLRKTVLVNGDRRELEVLRSVLRDTQAVQVCRHFESVAITVLRVIERYPRLSHDGVLAYLNGIAHTARPAALLAQAKTYVRLLEELDYLGQDLNIPNLTRLLRRCRTLDHLQRYHDRWTERFNHDLECEPTPRSLLTRDALPNRLFPDPPLPDCATIQAIRNARELRAEGRQMNHCVGSYEQPIVRGEVAIYRVLAPERGTLALSGSGANLRIREFRLSHNRHPSKDSWQAVRAWVKRSIPSI
jgi:hypothetical protein